MIDGISVGVTVGTGVGVGVVSVVITKLTGNVVARILLMALTISEVEYTEDPVPKATCVCILFVVVTGTKLTVAIFVGVVITDVGLLPTEKVTVMVHVLFVHCIVGPSTIVGNAFVETIGFVAGCIIDLSYVRTTFAADTGFSAGSSKRSILIGCPAIYLELPERESVVPVDAFVGKFVGRERKCNAKGVAMAMSNKDKTATVL